jgi:nucleotide-binding universal stress UspA family protein
MLRWKKILVATDFSPSADVALRSAESLAREGGGALVVVHVVEPITPGYSTRGSTLGLVDIETVSEREAHATLEKIVAASHKRGIPVQAVLRVGKPWVEILEVALEQGVEAICLGNSGRSMFGRLLLGSTAENVVRRSTLPVLVTRDRPLAKIRRVLVPVAFDAGSKQALRVARQAITERTRIMAIHVTVPVSAFDPMVGILIPDEAGTAEELRNYLGKKALGRARLEVRVASDVTAGVLDSGAEGKADLIVISTHGRRGLPRALQMKESDVGSVVVLDSDGDVAGIVTDRDVAIRLVADKLPAATTPVDDIMTSMPFCVGRGMDVEQALKKMEVHGVRRIPVLDEKDELIGVVSLDDILIHLGKTLGVAAALIRAEVAGLV